MFVDLAEFVQPFAEKGFVHFCGEVVGGSYHGVRVAAADGGDGALADGHI